ncbi:MAG: SDR family oxidoreductase [Gammaproteobacteria bacterium]|nr:SDR family oxidoreductase [Gammaproteobacteria bacterium]NNF61877.1 SDR family oxidoreductase [Gammaproteobacteria bacterium]NNM19655.1 SDR family oxidoreductase [Gammaproteobacteria bacterium]
MAERFPQKRVFITGAGSGLGLAIARQFATNGWRVAVTDVDPARARTALEEVRSCGGDGFWAECDVRSADHMEQARERLQQEWAGVDVIVNNAGVGSAGTVIDTPLEDWEWVLDINLMGVVRGCHLFAPLLAAQRSGHIVNIASFAGIAQAPAMAGYNVAKIGVIGLSESLRAEMQPHGVGVSAVCPSFFKTNILEQFRSPDPRLRDVADKLVNRASVTADDVAKDIFKGVQKNRFMIIPHAEARWFYRFKRFAPELFFKILGPQAARMMGADKSGR